MRDFVYITSASYSGSTLLTFLLDTHSQVVSIGEMKGDAMDVEHYRCSCGAPIGRCPFWERLIARMRAAGTPFDPADVWTQAGFRIPDAPLASRVVRHRHRGRALELARDAFIVLSPACRRAFPRIVRTNEVFVEAATELTGRPIFVDASKDATRLKYLRRIPSFRTKVIYMVRDGRGVMRSFMKHYGASAQAGAREWAGAQREIACALRAVPASARLLLRYEDLCADPRGAMERVFRFIGVAPEPVSAFRSVEHHILGNAMRLDGRSEIRLDARWMEELGPAELQVFDRIAGAENRRLGYPRELPARRAAPGTAALASAERRDRAR
jgi:hypothetical protein